MQSSANERLFAAIARADIDAARAAVADGADVNANGPSGGETPLMRLRLCRDPLPLLALLLAAGADPKRTDLAGRTALHHLALGSILPGVDAVLRLGADPHQRDRDGLRALDVCLHQATGAVLERLLQAMQPLDRDDRTRLFRRHLQRGETEAALTQIAAGIELAPKDRGVPSPLHLAARAGSIEVVRALLDAGAAVDPLCGADETPLMLAAQHGHAGVVRLLLARGADAARCDRAGASALHRAAGSRLAVPARLAEAIGALLEAGVDPLQRDAQGYWPRALARACGNHELLDLLPGLALEPALDESARHIESVQLATSGDQRLRWLLHDMLRPFALEERIQRDEWNGRSLDTGSLAREAAGWQRLPELAWFLPLLDRMRQGEALTLATVRAAAEAAGASLDLKSFRAG